jgi:hypothetical protein
LAAAAASPTTTGPTVVATVLSRQTLWKPTKQQKLMRIPALAALNASHVLAFAEVHVMPGNRIVGRLSQDGGESWGAEQVIAAGASDDCDCATLA